MINSSPITPLIYLFWYSNKQQKKVIVIKLLFIAAINNSRRYYCEASVNNIAVTAIQG